MGRDRFEKEFLLRGLLGLYLSVARVGEVGAGDRIVELARDPRGFRVTEVARLFSLDRDDFDGLRRAADLDVLPESWREYFRRRLVARAA
jgi:MOSC domain-containing protein YiiM